MVYRLDHKWHRRFLGLAEHISGWSKDPSMRVGAVIVNPETRVVVGMGYNGFPRGVNDTDDRLNDRPTKYKLVVHAEANALLNATGSTRGCVLYVTPTLMVPNICPECAKLAAQAGIILVFGWLPANEQQLRWQDQAEFSRAILNEAGIGYELIER